MAPVRAQHYRTLASLSRINLLHALQHGGPMTVEQLAEATGLHHNTAREHLHRLIAAGFVDSEPEHTTTRGRPRVRYSTTVRRDDPALVERVRIASERGRQVRRMTSSDDGASELQQQLDLLDDHMDQCGFDASREGDGMTVTVHECPFSALAREHPQVCEVHFGLVRDTIQQTGGPLEAERLNPFADDGTCSLGLCTASRER